MKALPSLFLALLVCCADAPKPRVTTSEIVLDKDSYTWTGTFTSLHANSDGVFGVEIRTAVTDRVDGQAVVQFGYGDFCSLADHGTQACFRVSNLLLVDLSETTANAPANSTKFTIPRGEFAGSFSGHVSREELIGTFVFESGRTLHVTLRRGKSHWER